MTDRVYCVLEQFSQYSEGLEFSHHLANNFELIIPATDHSTVSIMMQGQHLYFLLFCDTKVIIFYVY